MSNNQKWSKKPNVLPARSTRGPPGSVAASNRTNRAAQGLQAFSRGGPSASGFQNPAIARSVFNAPSGVNTISMSATPAGTSIAPTLAGTASQMHNLGRTRTKPADYRPGMVITAPHFLPNMDPNADLSMANVATTRAAGPVSGKIRPMVVLAITQSHMKCVPLFTSQGNGFANVPNYLKWECVYLRHWTDDDTIWKTRGHHEYLMTIPTWIPKGGCYLKWSLMTCVEYSWPITVMGGLSYKSFARLQEMHRIGYEMRTTKDLRAQQDTATLALAGIKVDDEFTEMKLQAAQRAVDAAQRAADKATREANRLAKPTKGSVVGSKRGK